MEGYIGQANQRKSDDDMQVRTVSASRDQMGWAREAGFNAVVEATPRPTVT